MCALGFRILNRKNFQVSTQLSRFIISSMEGEVCDVVDDSVIQCATL